MPVDDPAVGSPGGSLQPSRDNDARSALASRRTSLSTGLEYDRYESKEE